MFSRKSFCSQIFFFKIIFDEIFWFKPVFEQIIWHPKKGSTKKMLMKILGSNLFLRKSFCNQKNFYENFWFKSAFEKIILHPKKF